MTTETFKYDVAFSFLAQDEELATQINERLMDRLSTFIYSRKQEEIAGKDGEEVFNRVFGSEARTVFVLYRKGWGETPWTRIEKTAIQNRAYDEGYDFVLLAPLDKPPAKPKWLPNNRIWIGLDRWGIEGAASVIEARVQETGGKPKEESAKDRALRLNREIDAEEARQRFLGSEEGVKSANREVSKLFTELKRVVSHFSKNETAVSLRFKKDPTKCVIYGGGFSVLIHWSVYYANTLDSSGLSVSLWEDHVRIRGGRSFPFQGPKRIKEIEFNFDLNRAAKPVWRQRTDQRHYSTKDLSKLCITLLFDKIRDHTISKGNEF